MIRFLRYLSLISALALCSVAANAAPNTGNTAQSLLHALDYLAVDYPQVVINGEIIDAGEYAEQREFAAQAKTNWDQALAQTNASLKTEPNEPNQLRQCDFPGPYM